ncbi:MAG: hypothetical protein ABIR52_05080 [Casimicrobiaceae bacterium]
MVVALAGCIYDAPLTANATHRVDARLVGDWSSDDGKELLKVRTLDNTTYLLVLNGDPFRAWHSDFADTPFVTVQDLDAPSRKYAYLKYALSDDGTRLTAFAVNTDLIPATLKSSSEARRLVRANLDNPKLFVDEPLAFVRRK